MMKLNYSQQIKHPLWQKKRLEVMELNNFSCVMCGTKDTELNVHHPFYKRGAMIWDYDNEELQCLCVKCHKEAHRQDEEIRTLLSDININKEIVIGCLKAMNDHPGVKLNSYEEIIGYLDYYNIHDPIQEELINSIVECKGYPHQVLDQSPFTTSYHDMGRACFYTPKSLIELFKKGEKECKRRIESIKNRSNANE